MIIGYIRVSCNTDTQYVNLQTNALLDANCEKVFIDKVSGATAHRPQLSNMLEILKQGDTVIVTELARFGKSTKDLIDLMEKLNKIGVQFKSLKESTIDTNIFAVLANFERTLITIQKRERTQSAKAKGKVGGRPTANKSKIDEAIKMHEGNKYTIDEICDLTKVSKTTLYKYLNLPKEKKGKRARGNNGGRPSTDKDKIRKAIKLYNSGKCKLKEIVSATGISTATLYKYLKAVDKKE